MFEYVDKINHRSKSLNTDKALKDPIVNISFYESIIALKSTLNSFFENLYRSELSSLVFSKSSLFR